MSPEICNVVIKWVVGVIGCICTNLSILINIFYISDLLQAYLEGEPVTLKLTMTNPESTVFTKWFVEYVDITMNTQFKLEDEFRCHVGEWLAMPE